jgi:hypothetical protein
MMDYKLNSSQVTVDKLIEKLDSHKSFSVKGCNLIEHSRKGANRVCSYCGSNSGYVSNKESNSHWYSLITRDNKRSLYFLCSNCYAKQVDKNPKWSPMMLNGKIEYNIKRIKFLS